MSDGSIYDPGGDGPLTPSDGSYQYNVHYTDPSGHKGTVQHKTQQAAIMEARKIHANGHGWLILRVVNDWANTGAGERPEIPWEPPP